MTDLNALAGDEPAPPAPAIAERGELSLELGGMTLGLRPSFEAIVAFELETGKGLLELARDSLNYKLTVPEAAQIATHCIRAWGERTGNLGAKGANAQKVGKLILGAEGGFRAVLAKLSGMLSLAATGGYTPEGEIKPAPETMTA